MFDDLALVILPRFGADRRSGASTDLLDIARHSTLLKHDKRTPTQISLTTFKIQIFNFIIKFTIFTTGLRGIYNNNAEYLKSTPKVRMRPKPQH